jgi:DNA invertase Pin-like site-specific DNA recombinase
MKATDRKGTALAFSYLRFSTPEQARGDSIRRQVELRDAWLKRTGATLDTSLTLEDKGVSGYTGEHRKNPDRNALARFLEAVKRGRVPRGSFLVIENLDRLTREHIRPALTLLLNLIDAGVQVVQLTPVEQVFGEDVEPMALVMAIMELSRGHGESRLKSQRIGKGWRTKKQQAANGMIVTRSVPKWLKVEGDKIVPVPERVEAVRRMFRMAADGFGMIQIAKSLTAAGVATFGRSRTWGESTVYQIIHGRQAVGEYVPRTGYSSRKPDGDPVPAYYPPAVTEAEWAAANAGLRNRRTGGGRPAVRHFNPFSGLLIDARDGEKIYQTTDSKAGPAVLLGRGKRAGVKGSVYASFPARAFVHSLLSQLREVPTSEVLPPTDRKADRVTELTAKVARKESLIAALRAELEGGSREVKAAVQSLAKLEDELEAMNVELAHARAEAAVPLADAWSDCRSLAEAVETAPDRQEAQVRLRAALRRSVEGIWCLFVRRGHVRLAAVQVWFKGGRHRDYLIRRRRPNGDRAEELEVRSIVFDGKGGRLDLRNPVDAAATERLLVGLDLSKLTANRTR